MREVCIVVFVVLCGAYGLNVGTVGEDVQGCNFGELVTRLSAFEVRIQEQIGSLDTKLSEVKGEMMRATTQILLRIEGIESAINRTNNETQDTVSRVYEGIEKKLDTTEKAVRKLAQDHSTIARVLQNNLLALNKSDNGCITKEIFSHLLEDQSNRLIRRMEQTTVASGMQQMIFDNKNDDVYVDSRNNHGFGGNWIVFQKRFDGYVNFNRSWAQYKAGFGYINGDHWLGLEQLSLLLQRGRHDLLIVLEDFDGVIAYEHYDEFQLGNASTNYHIKSFGSYTGNARNSFAVLLGHPFCTYDNDFLDLAKSNGGGWWFKKDTESFLNGGYRTEDENAAYGLSWSGFRGINYSLKSTKMMVRPHNY